MTASWRLKAAADALATWQFTRLYGSSLWRSLSTECGGDAQRWTDNALIPIYRLKMSASGLCCK
jgi:hypothetical protein